MAKILQLTVLDPAIHTRIYYKIGLSLAKLGHQIAIVGTDRVPIPTSLPSNIKIHLLPKINRSALQRLVRPFQLLGVCFREKPEILIVHSIELLHIASLFKFFSPKTKLIYDVLEDYSQNLRYHPILKSSWKKILAPLVRVWEKTFLPFFAVVWYAELCYENILKVSPEKKYFILNRFTEKILAEPFEIPEIPTPYMVNTGTLHFSWGIPKVLELWEAFNHIQPLHLVIVGFTYNSEVLAAIQACMKKSPYRTRFTLVGGDTYVPYPQVIQLIRNAAFGMGLYDLPPNIKGKIPTKFYEYAALQKPLLFTSDETWNDLNQKWQLGIAVSPSDSAASIWQAWINFQKTPTPSAIYSWEENEEKLLAECLKKLLG